MEIVWSGIKAVDASAVSGLHACMGVHGCMDLCFRALRLWILTPGQRWMHAQLQGSAWECMAAWDFIQEERMVSLLAS